MAAQRGVVSIGLAGTLGPDTIGAVAPAIEDAGFHALWVNDNPGGDSLAALAAAAAVTERLTLATGVIPVDRRTPGDISRHITEHGLPEGRLVLGIGSGRTRDGALQLMRDAVSTLRAATSARIVVGALGPRMRRLAVTDGDGLLLNWLTPDAASSQTRQLRGVAPEAWVALYVRTALDPDARGRLEDEASRYGAMPQYAANFSRIGATPLDTVLPQPGQDDAGAGLTAYTDAVDEVVLRAITPSDSIDDLRAFVAQAAALHPPG